MTNKELVVKTVTDFHENIPKNIIDKIIKEQQIILHEVFTKAMFTDMEIDMIELSYDFMQAIKKHLPELEDKPDSIQQLYYIFAGTKLQVDDYFDKERENNSNNN